MKQLKTKKQKQKHRKKNNNERKEQEKKQRNKLKEINKKNTTENWILYIYEQTNAVTK